MFVLLDKPKCHTSFDCIRKLQKLYWKKIYERAIKIGHAWTLDPMATWLMIIAIGKSTKQLWTLTGLSKTYTTTIDFSQATDTRDIEAWWWKAQRTNDIRNVYSRALEVTKKYNQSQNVAFIPQKTSFDDFLTVSSKRWYSFTKENTIPTKEQIVWVLNSFIAREEFLLTPFSAKKVEGKKLYEYARAWDPILKYSPMRVLSYELLSYTFPEVTIRFEVWSWTYIRTLWFELWKALGWWGVLTTLRREKVWKRSI